MAMRRAWMCGTPGCKGMHTHSAEAFDCHAMHLEKSGFKKLGSREFENPETGAVRILTKKSRFGLQRRVDKGSGGTRSHGGNTIPCKGRTHGIGQSKNMRKNAILSL